jgi:steroid 5-alpha reductase family enzyme
MIKYIASMSLAKSRLLVSLLYVLLFVTGAYLTIYLPESNKLIKLLIIDVILTIVIFLQSAILKNASTYDAYWSVIPFYFLFYWLYEFNVEALNYRMMALIILTSFWSWRLTLNWYRGWNGYSHEDWRYVELRSKTGVFYPIVNFLGIHLFPTLLVFAAALPMEYVFSSDNAFTLMDAAGAAVMFIGVLFEMTADNQMHRFKSDPTNKGKFIDVGIWRYSRHPNYLGEILFWWGMYMISINAGAPDYILIGPIAISLLFIGISIPMMEKRLQKNYPDYRQYKKTTPFLFPYKRN